MSLIHLLLSAVSLSAVATGAWSVDRVIDRHARISEAPAEASPQQREEDEDPKLLY